MQKRLIRVVNLGRSHAILKIPSKPIPEGYKAWALAQDGYILAWLWHMKKKGPLGIPRIPKELGNNKTAAVVPFLLNLLPKIPGFQYVVWLDNLFTSTNLLNYLRTLGYGATGTCRTNSGICQDFVDKKTKDSKVDNISWGSTFQEPTTNNHIVQTAWKDNALVLLMSTIHEASDPQNTVIRLRKRPKSTSTSAKTARKPFGDRPTKKLPIPKLIDDYNHNMNAVDRADQLRASKPGVRRVRRGGWHALWLFMFNITLCNSFKLSSVQTQEKFRTMLYKRLLEEGASTRKRKWVNYSLEPDLFSASKKQEIQEDHVPAQHKQVHRGKIGECKGCKLIGRTRSPNKRRILGEISLNTRNNTRPKRSYYGCLACNIALCRDGPCFEQYHEHYVHYS
jgi:hypothetical protein